MLLFKNLYKKQCHNHDARPPSGNFTKN